MSAAAVQPVAIAPSQIKHQLNELHDVLQDNEKPVSELEANLSSTLREPIPPSNSPESVPAEFLVPMANGIREMRKIATQTNYALRSILGRMEL